MLFSDDSVDQLASRFKWALVGKLSFGFNKENPDLGRPPVEKIQKFLESLDLKGCCSVGLLDNRHVIIWLQNEIYFIRLYSRPVWYVNGIAMRIFKWTVDFHVEQEPPSP